MRLRIGLTLTTLTTTDIKFDEVNRVDACTEYHREINGRSLSDSLDYALSAIRCTKRLSCL